MLLLRAFCNVSDREAEERARYDLRWKKVLHLSLDEAGFDYSLPLSRFRTRLLLSGTDREAAPDVLAGEREELEPYCMAKLRQECGVQNIEVMALVRVPLWETELQDRL